MEKGYYKISLSLEVVALLAADTLLCPFKEQIYLRYLLLEVLCPCDNSSLISVIALFMTFDYTAGGTSYYVIVFLYDKTFYTFKFSLVSKILFWLINSRGFFFQLFFLLN